MSHVKHLKSHTSHVLQTRRPPGATDTVYISDNALSSRELAEYLGNVLKQHPEASAGIVGVLKDLKERFHGFDFRVSNYPCGIADFTS